MPNARLMRDVDMSGWPPKTYLVQLENQPMTRFDPETGEPEYFEYVALTVSQVGGETFVFPSNEMGQFVDSTMVPMKRRQNFEFPHDALADLGYLLVN